MKNFLSLGGGVQSTALLLMSLHGDVDVRYEAAIFSDTGWERDVTYENVERLRKYAETFDVPVVTVKKPGRGLKHEVLDRVSGAWIPAHIDKNGKAGMLKRQCTSHYKITPIHKWIRANTDAHFKRPVAMHIGISIDEVQRMKPSRVKYLVNTYPLVDNRISRAACHKYLTDHNWEPSKSSCVGCPYHGDAEWRALSEEELQSAIAFEEQLQERGLYRTNPEYDDSTPYLHRSLRPLSERPFEKNPDQLEMDLESEECEGGCFL